MSNFKRILEHLKNLDKMPLDILGESFKLNEVPFGTDIKNKQWKTIKDPLTNNSTTITFFHLTGSGKQYIILIDSNKNIKFNVIENFDTIDDDLNNPEFLFKFTKYERSQGNINIILGSILSVLKRSKLNFNTVYFQGNDKKLNDMYLFFATNNKVMEYLKTINVTVEVKNNILICNF